MEFSVYSTTLALALSLITVAYYYLHKRYAYFKDRGILYDRPTFPFGGLKGVGTKQHVLVTLKAIYDTFVGKDILCGLYFFVDPVYMILDPELLKHILVKDFNKFHGQVIYEKADPKLSPKLMYDIMLRSAERLERNLEPIAANSGIIEMNDFFGRFSSDVFTNVTFGVDCSSLLMSCCLLELAQNPDIQDKVRADIGKITKKYGDKVTYESVLEMVYLDNAITETLRKFPVAKILFRTAIEKYKVPNSKHVIEKGRMILIPVIGMHTNPNIFPNPDKFDPDRFLPENKAKRHPFTYLPFGECPLNNIGVKCILMQIRLGLVHVLRKYKVTVCEKTPMMSSNMSLKNSTWVRLKKL